MLNIWVQRFNLLLFFLLPPPLFLLYQMLLLLPLWVHTQKFHLHRLVVSILFILKRFYHIGLYRLLERSWICVQTFLVLDNRWVEVLLLLLRGVYFVQQIEVLFVFLCRVHHVVIHRDFLVLKLILGRWKCQNRLKLKLIIWEFFILQ